MFIKKKQQPQQEERKEEKVFSTEELVKGARSDVRVPGLTFKGATYYTPDDAVLLPSDVNETLYKVSFITDSYLHENIQDIEQHGGESTEATNAVLENYRANRETVTNNLFGSFYLTVDSLYKRLITEINEVIVPFFDMGFMYPMSTDNDTILDMQLDIMNDTISNMMCNKGTTVDALTFTDAADMVMPRINAFGIDVYNKIRLDVSEKIYMIREYDKVAAIYQMVDDRFKTFMADLSSEAGLLCLKISQLYELM